MQRFGRDATLEERAVVAAEQHAVAFARPRLVTKSAPVESWSRSAHPMAWAYGLEVTKGDASRLQVLDDGYLLIHNQPWRKR